MRVVDQPFHYRVVYSLTTGANLVMAAINAWVYLRHGQTLGATVLVVLPLVVAFGMTFADVVFQRHQQLIAKHIALVETQIAAARVDQVLKEHLLARLDAGGASVEVQIEQGDNKPRSH